MAVYLDDKKLVKQLLDGDERAFSRFFDESFARLYRFTLMRYPGDTEAAREIVQITMTKAVRNLHQYRAESALFTWLCAICRNEASSWFARQGRYRDHIVLTEDLPDVRAAVDSFHAAEKDDPEWNYQRVEALRLIQVALDRLPVRYGNVLEWKYVEGHSVKVISERLNLGTEATQSLVARAKRAFADIYTSLTDNMDHQHNELVQS